jgi:hypothetical protein
MGMCGERRRKQRFTKKKTKNREAEKELELSK